MIYALRSNTRWTTQLMNIYIIIMHRKYLTIPWHFFDKVVDQNLWITHKY